MHRRRYTDAWLFRTPDGPAGTAEYLQVGRMYLSDGKAFVVVVVVVVPVPLCCCVGTYHSPTPESWMFFDVGECAPSPMVDHLHEMEEAAASYLGQVRACRVLNIPHPKFTLS